MQACGHVQGDPWRRWALVALIDKDRDTSELLPHSHQAAPSGGTFLVFSTPPAPLIGLQ